MTEVTYDTRPYGCLPLMEIDPEVITGAWSLNEEGKPIQLPLEGRRRIWSAVLTIEAEIKVRVTPRTLEDMDDLRDAMAGQLVPKLRGFLRRLARCAPGGRIHVGVMEDSIMGADSVVGTFRFAAFLLERSGAWDDPLLTVHSLTMGRLLPRTVE